MYKRLAISKFCASLIAGLLSLCLIPGTSEGVEFQLGRYRGRLLFRNTILIQYHSFAEPINPYLGRPAGQPLNFFNGLDIPLGENRLNLTRLGAGQGYTDLSNRLNIQLSIWRIQAGIRLDTTLFINPPQQFDPQRPELGGCQSCEIRFINKWITPTGLEKTFIRYSDRKWDIIVGDFYAVFGRGLVLSVRKVDELGIDTTILGGKISYTAEANEDISINLTMLGGVSNIQNVDLLTGSFEKDPFDIISGLRFEARLRKVAVLGIHATVGAQRTPTVRDSLGSIEPRLRCDETSSEGCYQSRRVGFGVSLDLRRLFSFLDLYVELATFQRVFAAGYFDEPVVYKRLRESEPLAFYANATAQLDAATTITLEAKYYRNFEPWYASTSSRPFNNIFYNLPPTAERLLTDLEDAQANIYGLRFLYSRRVNQHLAVVLSEALFRQERFLEVVSQDLMINDFYAGVQFFWQRQLSHLSFFGGYRSETQPDADRSHRTVLSFDWDLVQALPRRLSLETQGRTLVRSKEGEPDWTEGNASIAIKWTSSKRLISSLIGTLGLDWSTQQMTISERGVNYLIYGFFPNTSFQYNFRPDSGIRLFVGGQRGGLRCASGVCRVFPEMRGLRLEAFFQF